MKKTCDLPVPADVADGLLRLRASALRADTDSPDAWLAYGKLSRIGRRQTGEFGYADTVLCLITQQNYYAYA